MAEMVAGSRRVEKWSRADSAAASASSCSWSWPSPSSLAAGAGADDPSVFVASDVDLALSAGVGAGGELLDESFSMTPPASEDGDEGAVAGGGAHTGRVFTRPGGETGTMTRVTFVLSLPWGRSARLVFCMIFVWELRVSAKRMVSLSVARWVR